MVCNIIKIFASYLIARIRRQESVQGFAGSITAMKNIANYKNEFSYTRKRGDTGREQGASADK